MRYLIAGRLVFAVWLLTMLQVSCLPDDVCGKGYQYKDKTCFKIADTKKTLKDASLAAADREAGDDDSGEIDATGLGDSCVDETDCEGKDASYCLVNPTNGEGACTIQGCTDADGSCPGEYRCCKMPDSFGGAVCLDPTQYQTADSMGVCGN